MNQIASFAVPDAAELQRQSIVRLVSVLFVLLIFEGALRKWVAPELSNQLLFIRDPFLLIIYYKALRQQQVALRETLMLGLIVSLLVVLLAMVHVAIGNISLLVGGYGVRSYVLYLPLPFVMYSNLRAEDVERLLLLLLKISVPLGALAVVQSFLPATDWLNVGLGDGDVFTSGNQVRTYGTFTFTAGHVNYISFMVPLAAGAIVFFEPGSAARRWALLSMLAMCSAAVTSGSRAVVLSVGLTLLLYLLCVVLVRDQRRSGQLLSSVVLIAALGFGSYFAFEDRFANIADRFVIAQEIEGSILERALAPISGLFSAIGEGSFLGVGVGKGTGGGSYLGTGEQNFVLSEVETFRIIQESGALVGGLYIAFRITLLVLLMRFSLWHFKYFANSLPLILLAFMTPSLLLGQITLNNTSNGFNWLGVGLCLCLCQLRPQRTA